MAERITLTIDEDQIGTLAMHDEAGKNAFDEEFAHLLAAKFAEASAHPTIKVLVLLGLPDVFSSGAPRSLLGKLARNEVKPTDLTLSKALLDVPVPTIAAMEGHATGGGLALGVCADIVMLARESRYGASFMSLGFTPGMSITRQLEHVFSPAIAHELLYTAEFRKGSELEGRCGANYILPRAELREMAYSVAARIAEKPRLALETLKRTLAIRRRQTFEETLAIESLMHAVTFKQSALLSQIEESYVE